MQRLWGCLLEPPSPSSGRSFFRRFEETHELDACSQEALHRFAWNVGRAPEIESAFEPFRRDRQVCNARRPSAGERGEQRREFTGSLAQGTHARGCGVAILEVAIDEVI